MSNPHYKKVGVIGAGTMGNGIAQVFATAGSEVLMVDAAEAALERGQSAIAKSLARSVKKERMTQAEADAICARVKTSTTIADLTDQELVVEAVVEKKAVKSSVLQELIRLCRRERSWLPIHPASQSPNLPPPLRVPTV